MSERSHHTRPGQPRAVLIQQRLYASPMPAPKRILTCRRCGQDLAPLIDTPWIRTCPECGTPFDPDFLYDGRPPESPEPNTLPPEANEPRSP